MRDSYPYPIVKNVDTRYGTRRAIVTVALLIIAFYTSPVILIALFDPQMLPLHIGLAMPFVLLILTVTILAVVFGKFDKHTEEQ